VRAVGLILIAVGLAALAAVWSEGPARGGQAASATIGIHFSHYTPTEVVARAGEPLRVTLVNTDPIEHEWLVGDAAFHERHRTGTETHHGARPNEVSLAPGETKTTTVVFEQPGDYLYICHLPGHEQYGMVGVLRVLPAPG
jgi:uncharacterized cupredoxin-like copper-binding protein